MIPILLLGTDTIRKSMIINTLCGLLVGQSLEAVPIDLPAVLAFPLLENCILGRVETRT
jgi:hypothetical protein